MAVPVSKIGVFAFIRMTQPQAPREQPVIHSRPGVDNVQISLTGKRGSEFQCTTGVDAADKAAGRNLFASYRDLIGGDPVQLVWSDINMIGESYRVFVIDVELIDLRSLAVSSGNGINPPSLAWLEARWTLIPISV